MPAFLAEQIGYFGEVSESDRWRNAAADEKRAEDIAELAATATFLLDRIETAAAKEQPPAPAWNVATARRFVPLFRQWFTHASRVLKLIQDSHSRGHVVEGASEFVHRFNVAKLLATDVDHTAANYESSPASGERNGVPLEEAIDELRRRSEHAGGQ